ncbi:SAMD9 protein, partial [Amia calva]|nr:SAMD9 protein [Amia calva]
MDLKGFLFFSDYKELPIEEWTESHVNSWLKSIGIKEQYIVKLPPRFIEVIDRGSTGTSWVVEVDIVPKAEIVKGKLYIVCILTFNNHNKVEYNKRTVYQRDRNSCLPVLLLVEDCDEGYLDELRHDLGNAIATMNISPSVLGFILLNCKRSHVPERLCKALPLQTVTVTNKLSMEEKQLFSRKREKLFKQFRPEFILTFVLMGGEFPKDYIKNFVEHLLEDIDHSSLETRLFKYVALLNCYLQNSFILYLFILFISGEKIVHRSKIEKYIKGTLSERRLKWLSGEVWTTSGVTQLLKCVKGWTKSGNLFVCGYSKGSKIKVFPLYSASLPTANENITFFLGFSFNGAVAFDIQVLR